MSKEVGAFGGREACDKIAEGVPESLDGPQSSGAEQCLEFGESHLDWVQIGTVRRQVEQPGTGRLDGLAHPAHRGGGALSDLLAL